MEHINREQISMKIIGLVKNAVGNVSDTFLCKLSSPLTQQI